MADKVKLIKEEILRRKQSWQHSDKQYEHGGKDVCDYLLGFIDSLPEEPASEDLKEDYSFEKILQEIYIKYNKKISIESLLDIASHFAEWQKQQMMKDAVDAFVNTYENTDDSNYVEFVTEQSPYKFKETEKCKLIIVKED